MTARQARRTFLAAAPAVGVLVARRGLAVGGEEGEPADAKPAIYDEFPSQDPARVREIVAVSHGNFARVKELVTAQPALAKAAWDWGFGDWESALGAAAHTGNRDIAMFLIENGARPTLFSATMLGQLDVVRGFVEASPGVQRLPGPHGITLLAHARFGKEPAAPVLEYLESLGDADQGPQSSPLSEEEQRAYLGKYTFGQGPQDYLEVIDRRGSLMLQRGDGVARGLTYLGDNAFHPAGAQAVRIQFLMEEGQAVQVAIHDPDVLLTAAR